MAADSAPTAGSDRSVPSTSADLIDPNEPVPADPAVRHGPERTRLNRQCAAILAAFRTDPYHEQTNVQLAVIAYKYTSRISDLRRAGHRINIHYRNRSTGLNVYHYDGWGETATVPIDVQSRVIRRVGSAIAALLRSLPSRDTATGPGRVAMTLSGQLVAAGVTGAECRALAACLVGRPS